MSISGKIVRFLGGWSSEKTCHGKVKFRGTGKQWRSSVKTSHYLLNFISAEIPPEWIPFYIVSCARMNLPQISIELPSGVPVPSGVFGVADHHPGLEPLPLIHSDWDLVFIEEGHGIWSIKDKGRVDVPVDHFLLLPPFVSIRRESPESFLRLWFCHFSFCPVANSVYPSVRRDCLELERSVLIPMIFSKKEAPNVWLAYKDLLAIDLGSAGPPWRMAGAINRLVSELAAFALARAIPNEKPVILDPAAGQDHRVVDLCRRIMENPVYPWRVSKLAKSVGISVGHLDRLTMSSLGVSLKYYIVETRFRYALTLLRDSSERRHYSIKEISTACGFSSQELFAHQFKKFFGVTPSAFRRF